MRGDTAPTPPRFSEGMSAPPSSCPRAAAPSPRPFLRRCGHTAHTALSQERPAPRLQGPPSPAPGTLLGGCHPQHSGNPTEDGQRVREVCRGQHMPSDGAARGGDRLRGEGREPGTRGPGWGVSSARGTGGGKQLKVCRLPFTWQMHNSQGSPGDQICPTGNSAPLSSREQPGQGQCGRKDKWVPAPTRPTAAPPSEDRRLHASMPCRQLPQPCPHLSERMCPAHWPSEHAHTHSHMHMPLTQTHRHAHRRTHSGAL